MIGYRQGRGRFGGLGLAVAVLALGWLSAAAPAMAATASASVQVQAVVVAACRLPSGLAQQFDKLGPLYSCLPAPEVSRFVPPPARILPPEERAGGARVLTMEF